MLWRICSPLHQNEKIMKCLLTTLYQSTTHWAPQIRRYFVDWNYLCTMFKSLPSVSWKRHQKKERGSFDYRTKENRNIVVVKWFDNNVVALASSHVVKLASSYVVTLASSYLGIEPNDTVKRYNRSVREHVHVSRPNILCLYNQYMEGIDKLDIMCSLYKPP